MGDTITRRRQAAEELILLALSEAEDRTFFDCEGQVNRQIREHHGFMIRNTRVGAILSIAIRSLNAADEVACDTLPDSSQVRRLMLTTPLSQAKMAELRNKRQVNMALVIW